jgi:branched-chain amino acid transport system permease protein
MTAFIQSTAYGLANGAVLALAALGFTLIYRATGVINFAQGQLLLVGAYLFYTAFVVLHLPVVAAVGAGLVAAVAIGVVVERFILRPLVGARPVAVLMATIGLAAVLQAGVQMLYGTAPREMPKVLPAGTISVAGVPVPLDRITAVGLTGVVTVACIAFLHRSRHGVAMRAVADDRYAALAAGISVRRVFALAWALAAASALLGGAVLADIGGVSQNVSSFGLVVFPVVILGGLDSVLGTVAAGAVIGLVDQYADAVSPGASQVVPYVVLMLVLVLRPSGLFGQARIERV